MVTTLQHFWKRHRTLVLFGAMLTLLALSIIFIPHVVHAADPATPPPAPSSQDVLRSLMTGLSSIMGVLKHIFWPILLMIGGLMQNDILFGAGMEQRLNEIWVNVRNIVNILFVLILLGIALYNVLGAGENYHIKTILPKFVIALIAVNFTFLASKVVLDGVNIVSTAIFALPNQVQCSLNPSAAGCPNASTGGSSSGQVGILTKDQIKSMCAAIYGADPGTDDYNIAVNGNPPSGQSGDQSQTTSTAGLTFCTTTDDANTGYLNNKLVTFFNSMNANNAALIMALTLQQADGLDKVTVNSQNTTLGQLSVNFIFSIILYVVYGAAFVALFATLLIRLVVLWVLIAVSPLMVLPFVVPAIKDSLGEAGDIMNKFVQNAIVPIPVALVMSIGFIMLQGLKSQNLESATTTVNTLISNPTLNIGLLTSGVSTLQQLIVAVGATVFIWVGVFAAMDKTYAKGITESIKNSVSSASKGIAGFAVKSIPLFPVTKGGKAVNLGEMQAAMQQVQMKAQQTFQAQAAEEFPELFQGAAGLKMASAKNMGDLKKELGNVNRAQWSSPQFQTGLAQYFHKNPKDNAALKAYLLKTGYNGNYQKFIDDLNHGKVSDDEMNKLYLAMGIQPSLGIGGAKPATAQEAALLGGLKPEEHALMTDKKKQKDMVDKKVITADDQKKLAKDEKTLAPNSKASEEDKKKAREEVAAIAKKVDDYEKAEQHKQGNEADISVTIKNATAGKVGQQDFQTVEGKLQQQIANAMGKKSYSEITDAEKGGDAYKKAEQQVLTAAGQHMNAKQKEDLMTAAPDGGKNSMLSKVEAKAAGGPPPTPKEPAYVPQGKVTDVKGEDGVSLWDWDGTKWVQKKK